MAPNDEVLQRIAALEQGLADLRASLEGGEDMEDEDMPVLDDAAEAELMEAVAEGDDGMMANPKRKPPLPAVVTEEPEEKEGYA